VWPLLLQVFQQYQTLVAHHFACHMLHATLACAAATAAAAAAVWLAATVLYMLCRVFQPTKNAFVDTLRSVVADVKWFLLFLVLTMWGFAGAFYILFREDQQQFQVTSSLTNAALLTS